MADSRDADELFWVEPRRRGILPLDQFHLSRSLAKTLRGERFLHSRDLAFEGVIRQCAAAAEGREESWINQSILLAYIRLYREGHAHSVEVWNREGLLVGGLYGVKLGAAFFGESMFSRECDASKAALAHLIARLRVGGFRLLDTQFLTAHLARMGALEVSRSQYQTLLAGAIGGQANWERLDQLSAVAPVAGASAGDSVVAGRLDVAPDVRLRPELLAMAGPSGKSIVQLLSQTS